MIFMPADADAVKLDKKFDKKNNLKKHK